MRARKPPGASLADSRETSISQRCGYSVQRRETRQSQYVSGFSVGAKQDTEPVARESLDRLNSRWLALMRAGRFEAAWRVSDRALQLRAGLDCSAWPRHEQFIWRGDSLAGRRVLIRCYHGLGDTLQFARFVPQVRAMARETVLWVQPALIPLLETARCADRLLPLHAGVPDVEYDTDVELSELMHVLRVTPRALQECPPYIRVKPVDAARSGGALRVGLVWAAGEWDTCRTMRCEQLAPLAALQNVDWHLLQRGPALRHWCNGFGQLPCIETILDEARVLASLDLLITVDTCSAHLAGSLGVRVWTLLPYDADWRWMQSQSATLWYPSMRLIRQPAPGDWGGVVSQVIARLRAHLDGRRAVTD